MCNVWLMLFDVHCPRETLDSIMCNFFFLFYVYHFPWNTHGGEIQFVAN